MLSQSDWILADKIIAFVSAATPVAATALPGLSLRIGRQLLIRFRHRSFLIGGRGWFGFLLKGRCHGCFACGIIYPGVDIILFRLRRFHALFSQFAAAGGCLAGYLGPADRFPYLGRLGFQYSNIRIGIKSGVTGACGTHREDSVDCICKLIRPETSLLRAEDYG